MSPEIARGEKYGASADVYSFAILLWELATLKRPYHKYKTLESLDRYVFNGNERPSRRSILNTTLRNLLKQSWNDCAATRPPMLWLRLQLEQTVQELSEAAQAGGTPQHMKPCMGPP
jgi:serine/threonine-protein kinase TNNI3K